ncbi:MAG TPA: hypothetical protein VEF76_04640 [Patescibacteria group bacterium]|nr:hypothetical protein [Patescibacteria group bacterium]
MRWVTDYSTTEGLSFEIEREAIIGPQKEKEFHRYLLRAFEPLGELHAEYLQEDLIEAQMHALRKWGVPLAAWELHL